MHDTAFATTCDIGALTQIPRTNLINGVTSIEPMPNLSRACGGGALFVKRDDAMGFAFGGNKVRQLEFYLGEALNQDADTILITGAVQSNFVRLAAAASNKLGLDCHIQLEERVAKNDDHYRTSGNVFIDKLLGATLHHYPEGEDEAGADRQLEIIAETLRGQGKTPYIIHLAPGHPALGALGYVVAAQELLNQMAAEDLHIDRVVLPSGSGHTHGGLLFGLRALGCDLPVHGICVRRSADLQYPRIKTRCQEITDLLKLDANPVGDCDILVDDRFLAPGYGTLNRATTDAIIQGARYEALMLDPTYSGKAMAGFIDIAEKSNGSESSLFWHTGGTPGLFAYQGDLLASMEP